METTDKVIIKKAHCFFEQSGTFKNEFKKLGIEAEDYDIQNEFGQTDNVCDLFKAIEDAYDNKPSLFDTIEGGQDGDLIMAFFPCIQFCDAKTLIFKGKAISQRNKNLGEIMDKNIEYAKVREYNFIQLMKLVAVAYKRCLRLIIENPWNTSGETYLQNNFIEPAVVDGNRMLRGDFFVKPTAYWFINFQPKNGFTYQFDKKQKVIMKCKGAKEAGVCSAERSLISSDYARNFICDFILGKKQPEIDLTLF